SAPSNLDLECDHLRVVFVGHTIKPVEYAFGQIVDVGPAPAREISHDPHRNRALQDSNACGLGLPGDALFVCPALLWRVDDGPAPAQRHSGSAFPDGASRNCEYHSHTSLIASRQNGTSSSGISSAGAAGASDRSAPPSFGQSKNRTLSATTSVAHLVLPSWAW